MRVFVIGATGYIGSAIVRALRTGGHQVAGSARSDAAAEKLHATGAEAVVCDVSDPKSLEAPARRSDAVVYAVQYNEKDVFEVESAALRALVDSLGGSNKALIYTSGVWIYGNTGNRLADENAAHDPTPLVAHRRQLERIVLEGVDRGVRAIVIRPGDVYGRGGGLPAMWIQSAKESGAARFVGDGNSHWPMIHIDDLAQLFVLALEKAPAGAIYNAADETSFTVREMAEAASHAAGRNGAVSAWPVDEARGALGPFADALALDSRIDSRRAREELGWRTRPSTILDDLQSGSYAEGSAKPG